MSRTAPWPVTNLGPLTAPFTPPPSCTDFIQDGSSDSWNTAWGAQTCDGGCRDNPACWPTVTNYLDIPTPLLGWGVYSPGIQCPAGYSTACGYATEGATLEGVSSFEFQFAVERSENAVGCCPIGFACTKYKDSDWWQTCYQSVTQTTDLKAALCDGDRTVNASHYQVPKTQGSEVVDHVYLQMPMIQLVWREGDRTTTAAAETETQAVAASTAGSGTTIAGPTGTTVSVDTESSGLATGARIGIGVAVPVFVIGVAVAAWLVWRRRRRRNYYHQGLNVGENGGYDHEHLKPELPANAARMMVDGGYRKAELAAERIAVEADGRMVAGEGKGLHEMGGCSSIVH